jgi:hypothetical protein
MGKRRTRKATRNTVTVYRALVRIDFVPTGQFWLPGSVLDPDTIPEGLNLQWLIDRGHVSAEKRKVKMNPQEETGNGES